jgi:hypothetical protein
MATSSSDPIPPELRVSMDMEFDLVGPISSADQPRLQTALTDLQGVETVAFREGAGIAIRYDPEKVTRAELLTVVGQNGFQVSGTESAPAAPPIESSEGGN